MRTYADALWEYVNEYGRASQRARQRVEAAKGEDGVSINTDFDWAFKHYCWPNYAQPLTLEDVNRFMEKLRIQQAAEPSLSVPEAELDRLYGKCKEDGVSGWELVEYKSMSGREAEALVCKWLVTLDDSKEEEMAKELADCPTCGNVLVGGQCFKHPKVVWESRPTPDNLMAGKWVHMETTPTAQRYVTMGVLAEIGTWAANLERSAAAYRRAIVEDRIEYMDRSMLVNDYGAMRASLDRHAAWFESIREGKRE